MTSPTVSSFCGCSSLHGLEVLVVMEVVVVVVVVELVVVEVDEEGTAPVV